MSLSGGELCSGFHRYDVLQEHASDERPMITHARHRVHLEHALQFLEAFLMYGRCTSTLSLESSR